jgi:hypothetical protein
LSNGYKRHIEHPGIVEVEDISSTPSLNIDTGRRFKSHQCNINEKQLMGHRLKHDRLMPGDAKPDEGGILPAPERLVG